MLDHEVTTERFSSYKKRVVEIAREVVATYPPGSLDEQAALAYLKGLALSRWVFWRRVAFMHRHLRRAAGSGCLDFGCGLGIMLPFLARRFACVHAVDLLPDVAARFLERWWTVSREPPQNVSLAASLDDAGLPERSLDLILALDVLEHVENLAEVLVRMRGLLKEDGVLVVSGPTENALYKLGRRIVGFSGDYHHRSIYDIHAEMCRHFHVTTLRRILFPFPLFLVLSARARVQ